MTRNLYDGSISNLMGHCRSAIVYLWLTACENSQLTGRYGRKSDWDRAKDHEAACLRGHPTESAGQRRFQAIATCIQAVCG